MKSHFLRNPDEALQQLENQYLMDPNLDLLKRIDAVRELANLPPHRDSRLTVAQEVLENAQLQCLQALDISYLRFAIEELPDIDPNIREEIRISIDRTRDLKDARSTIDSELRDVMAGKPQSRAYLRLLTSKKIAPISMGPLPKGTEKHMTPHLFRAGAQERVDLMSKLRNETDFQAYVTLRKLMQYGLYNLTFLYAYHDGTDADATSLQFMGTLEALEGATLAQEEIWRAKLNEDPDPEWVKNLELQDRKWYSH